MAKSVRISFEHLKSFFVYKKLIGYGWLNRYETNLIVSKNLNIYSTAPTGEKKGGRYPKKKKIKMFFSFPQTENVVCVRECVRECVRACVCEHRGTKKVRRLV